MKKYILITFFVSIILPGYSQSFIWGKQFSGSDFKSANDLTVDGSGNVYTTGIFDGIADFDPGTGIHNLVGAGGTVFINKLDAQGNFVWAKQIGGFRLDQGKAISCDAVGNIYVTGDFADVVDFDPGAGTYNMTAAGGSDVFVLKLDPDGNFLFAKQIGGPGDELARDLQIDQSGNILFVCDMNAGTIDFDPGPGTFNITASGDRPFAVCKLNAVGNFIWAKCINSNGLIRVVKTDITGNTLFAGTFASAADFDPGPGSFIMSPLSLNYDAFLVKLDVSGNFIWAKQIGGYGRDEISDLQLDPSGNIILSGFSQDSVDYDPGPPVFTLRGPGKTNFILKLDNEAGFLWAKQIASPTAEQGNSLAIDQYDNIFIAGNFSGTADFDPGPGNVLLTSNGSNDTYICRLDAQGNFIAAKQTGGAQYDFSQKMIMDQFENLYITGTFWNTVDFDPGPQAFNLSAVSSSNADIFITKYGQSNKITGTTFLDINHDGIRQANEFPLRNVMVKATRAGYTYMGVSDSIGKYLIDADTGSYSVNFIPLPYYLTSIPSTHSINFGSTFGLSDTANDFGLQPIASVNDLRVTLTNIMAVRRGFKTIFRLTYENNGTTPLSGTVIVAHDTLLVFDTSAPVQTQYDRPTLSYNFSNLAPSSSGNVDITFNVPALIPLGAILKNVAIINPIVGDSTPTNNTDTLYVTTTGSFDPNDKTVLPSGPITPGFIANGNYLDYIIRFQNTGTDTAFTVYIRDTLSNNLNESDIRVLSASHPYTTKIEGTNIIEWRFNNILLPDSNKNEPKSHGFIRYRIRPRSTLVLGDQIKNKAAIYFDFNNPVITNETTTVVNVITAINPVRNAIATKVYPNPAHSFIYVKVEGRFGYRFYDMAGQLVLSQENMYDQGWINAGILAKGLYILQIKTKKGVAVHKILIQ